MLSSGLLHLFWLGALLPVITYFLKKRYPNNKFLNAVCWPLIFAGTGNVPPATGINYTSAFAVSFIFNKLIKGRKAQWWAKYSKSYFTGPSIIHADLLKRLHSVSSARLGSCSCRSLHLLLRDLSRRQSDLVGKHGVI